jgi:uncharacterized cupredoxin-like copper-binding protein
MKRLGILVLLSLALALLVACGGGGDNATNQPQAATLNVRGLDEFRFDPATSSVASGAQVTVNFENVGVLEHSWALVPAEVDPTTATEADVLAGTYTGSVAGGASQTITFAAPAAGTYNVVCLVPGHAVGGMVGDFTVTP